MKLPPRCAVSAAMALSSLRARDPVVFEKSFQTLTASSLSWIDDGLTSAETKNFVQNGTDEENAAIESKSPGSPEDHVLRHYYRVVAEALIRRKVFKILDKYDRRASPERVEEALKCHTLPETLQRELVAKYGGSPPTTWFDALEQLRDFCGKDDRAALWEHVLNHPLTAYVPVQCQECGHVVPDAGRPSPEADAALGLTEEDPSPEEAPLARAGWFRGPRAARVFVLTCPACGAVSRWFRSRDPRAILNPRRWGRLCGEQEDLRLDLANYLGCVSVRTLLPLDWDHIWSEFRIADAGGEGNDDGDGGSQWRQGEDDRNFAARLDEGIGAWTGILAVSPDPRSCGDATERFLSTTRQGGDAADRLRPDMARHRRRVAAARGDGSGASTQAGTVNGHAIERAGLSSAEVTRIMRKAAQEYGSRAWYQV